MKDLNTYKQQRIFLYMLWHRIKTQNHFKWISRMGAMYTLVSSCAIVNSPVVSSNVPSSCSADVWNCSNPSVSSDSAGMVASRTASSSSTGTGGLVTAGPITNCILCPARPAFDTVKIGRRTAGGVCPITTAFPRCRSCRMTACDVVMGRAPLMSWAAEGCGSCPEDTIGLVRNPVEKEGIVWRTDVAAVANGAVLRSATDDDIWTIGWGGRTINAGVSLAEDGLLSRRMLLIALCCSAARRI